MYVHSFGHNTQKHAASDNEPSLRATRFKSIQRFHRWNVYKWIDMTHPKQTNKRRWRRQQQQQQPVWLPSSLFWQWRTAGDNYYLGCETQCNIWRQIPMFLWEHATMTIFRAEVTWRQYAHQDDIVSSHMTTIWIVGSIKTQKFIRWKKKSLCTQPWPFWVSGGFLSTDCL